MFADTHCHLDFSDFDDRLPSIIGGLTENEIGLIVVPSVSFKVLARVKLLCKKDVRIYMALGLHPFFIDEHSDDDLLKLENELIELKARGEKRLIAIGEIGLDASCGSFDRQVWFFEQQLKIAERYGLPVILHVRKCHDKVLAMLVKFKLVGGVVHAFSGSYEILMRYVKQGLKIGVGPVITWPASGKTRNAIGRAPLDALVLETDSPDMYVAGVTREQSSPLDVIRVFSVLAVIRGESEGVLKLSLWHQSVNLFGLNSNDLEKQL